MLPIDALESRTKMDYHGPCCYRPRRTGISSLRLDRRAPRNDLLLVTEKPNRAAQLANLSSEGASLIRQFPSWDHEQTTRAYVQFLTRALTLVGLCYGSDGHHYIALKAIRDSKDKSGNSYYIYEVAGVVDAAYADWMNHDDFRPTEHNVHDTRWALERIDTLLDRFHLVQRSLRNRHKSRPTLSLEDEYDVQDLLRSLLNVDFDDVRDEEYTPTYAGGASRVDFLLKDFGIVIEVKRSRDSLSTSELGKQLIVDIARYAEHPNCKILVCFVYDPEGRVSNPRGLENDLENMKSELTLRMRIRPQ
jgi:hypothetical protein